MRKKPYMDQKDNWVCQLTQLSRLPHPLIFIELFYSPVNVGTMAVTL